MHIYIFNASQIVSFYCWLVTSISTVGNQNYNVVASTKRNRIPFGKLWEKKSWKKRHKIHRLKTVGGAHHRLLPFPNKANRRNRRRRLFLPSSRCWCPRAGKSYNFFELFVKKIDLLVETVLYLTTFGWLQKNFSDPKVFQCTALDIIWRCESALESLATVNGHTTWEEKWHTTSDHQRCALHARCAHCADCL